MLTTFEVLAQPIRRTILDRLRDREHLVGEIADDLGLAQPATSKHLRVLRDAGLVTVRVDGPRRWYQLRVDPLAEIDDWLAPYRWMWEARLDRLGTHLDAMSDDDEAEQAGRSSQPTRGDLVVDQQLPSRPTGSARVAPVDDVSDPRTLQGDGDAL
jgi:DNA-binding transcriptional ArsR family regulator